MWVVLMTGAIIGIVSAQYVSRYLGLTALSYFYYCMANCLLAAWMVPLAYQKAGNMTQPYFYSLGLLSLLGFIGSVVIFKEHPSTQQIVGCAAIILGVVLLGKG